MNLHALALIVLSSVSTLSSTGVSASESAAVTRLKADTVVLVDAKGNEENFPRAKFAAPWPVKGKNPDGSYSVEVDGETLSVAPWYVEVKGMTSLVTPPACLDNKDTRMAATRNVGDGCTKK